MTGPLSEVGKVVAATVMAVFFSSAALADEERSVSNVPYFPLRADTSVVTEHANLHSGSVLYQQALHPVAGIRTTASIPLHFAAGMLMGGNLDVTVPAGTVFLSTIFEKSLYFCSAQSLQNSTLWGIVEVAVCLRDGDGNGVADQQIVLKNDFEGKVGMGRVQNIFELLGEQKNISATQVSVAYEKIPAESLPALDLKMSVAPAGLFRRSGGAVVLQVCVPSELSTVPKDGVRCAYVDWKNTDVVDTTSNMIVKGTLQFDNNMADVKWGPVDIQLQRQAGEEVSVKNVKALPSGVLALIGTARFWRSSEAAAVVAFAPLPPVPALMEIGDVR